MGSDAVLAGSGVDATVGEGLFIAATSACSISSVCSRNASPPEASTAGVSLADGWEEDDDCWWDDESGLMSMGDLCGGGEEGTIISPGGSVVSWLPAPGNSLCVSRASTCRVNGGTVRVEAPAVSASGAGPPGGAGVHARPFSASLLARAVSTA